MTSLKEFDRWMEAHNPQKDHNQALLLFLTDRDGKGFALIKDYAAFCQLGKSAQLAGYHTSDEPCSPLEFGRAVVSAEPYSFNHIAPSLPDSVKFECMAEKFHAWIKKSDASASSNAGNMLQQFLHTEGVLEHISNYAMFCELARTVEQMYGISNPPCSEITFYQMILSSPKSYFGEEPLQIPTEIIKQL